MDIKLSIKKDEFKKKLQITDGKDGAPGQKGEKGEMGKSGQPGRPGKDGSPDTPVQIADKLNSLTSVLSYKVLKDIPDFFNKGFYGGLSRDFYTKTETDTLIANAVAVENLWDRTIATSTLTPHTANDNVDIGTGNFTTTGTISGGIIRTNNYQNTAGTESFIWSAGDDWWELSNDLKLASGSLTASGTGTFGTLTVGSGSITDSSGAISFGNENLTTTGTGTFGSGIYDTAGTPKLSIDPNNRILYGSDGSTQALAWSGGTVIVDSDFQLASGHYILDNGATGVLDPGNKRLLNGWDLSYGTISSASYGISFSGGSSVISDGTNTSIDPYNRVAYNNLGSSVFTWSGDYLELDSSKSLRLQSGSVINDGTNTSIDPFNRKLYSSGGVEVMDYSSINVNYLKGANWDIAYDYPANASKGIQFWDSNAKAIFYSGAVITDGSNTSIDPYNRKLHDSSGNEIVDWSSSSGVKFSQQVHLNGNALSMGTGQATDGAIYASGANIVIYPGTSGNIQMPYGAISDGTQTSIDPYNRMLYASDGSTVMADYSTNDRMALGPDSTATNVNSFSFGKTAVASGERSMALGTASTASGYGALVLGFGSSASHDYATAIGVSAQASGYRSIAIGNAATATGESSTAIGDEADATNIYALALGAYTLASGDTSGAIGYGNIASNAASYAIGLANDVSGTYSTGIGIQAYVSGDYATNIGSYLNTPVDNDVSNSLILGGYSGSADEIWVRLSSGLADFQGNDITTTGAVSTSSLNAVGVDDEVVMLNDDIIFL